MAGRVAVGAKVASEAALRHAAGVARVHVGEDLEAADAKRDEMLVMMREMRGEIQALKALLAARGS